MEGGRNPCTILAAVIYRCNRDPFTKLYWQDKLEKSDDETLVDNKLLSYAYLEAGMIETIGSYVPISYTRV